MKGQTPVARRPSRRLATPTPTFALVLAVLVSAPSAAFAARSHYHDGPLNPNQRDAAPTRANINSSTAVVGIDRIARAGNHYPGSWDLWNVYSYSTGWACYLHGTPRNLGALTKNGHTVPVDTDAYDAWASDTSC